VTIKLTSDGAAVVDTLNKWIKINPGSPRGSKLQLIDRKSGVAQYGVLDAHNKFGYTHWAPCPTFEKESE